MHTITAVIRVRPGQEQIMLAALKDVGAHVLANEPDTQSYFIAQDNTDACVFTTYERFTDQAAMDRHNDSPEVARFYAIARPILAGEVILVKATEFSAKT